MTTTRNTSGLLITTNSYANGRIFATITIPEMTEENLEEYIEEFHRDAFRAINADLAIGGKHLLAPLVRVERSMKPTTTKVVFAECRDDDTDD